MTVFHLPPIGDKEIKVLEENAKLRDAMRTGPSSYQLIALALYYRDHPEEIPAPLKDKLAFLRELKPAAEERPRTEKEAKERPPLPEFFEKMKDKAGPGPRRRGP